MATAGSDWVSPEASLGPGPRWSSWGATRRSAGRPSGEIVEESGASTLVVTADLALPEDVDRAVAETLNEFSRIDILFNNAGINIRKPPQELTLEEWTRVLNTNLTSAFLMAKAVYPAMKRVGGGKIINTGSMTSIFGSSFAAAYATSKGGIVQLTKSLALAWAADNIQVNAILPGWFDTELTQQARQEIPGLHDRVLARIAHGRWATPEDMAGTAVWLASSASDYVTGVAIPVDGGYSRSALSPLGPVVLPGLNPRPRSCPPRRDPPPRDRSARAPASG